jgi:acetylornithine deacetylase/succinyl-diaminopimelate desuccinylase-like protein
MSELASVDSMVPGLEELLKICIETPSLSNQETQLLGRLKEIIENSETGAEFVEGPFGFAVIWPGKEGKESPLYLFDGHVDTVPVADEVEKAQWETDPFEAVRKGDNIYGKGSCDQIGGYVSALHALLEVAAKTQSSSREASMGMMFTRNEELAEGVASQDGYEALKDAGYQNVAGVISTEPSNGQLIRGQMGRLRLLLSDQKPEKLAALIVALQKYERTAKVNGKKQALALIAVDLKGSFEGRIDSQVPGDAKISFKIQDTSLMAHARVLLRDCLRSFKQSGKVSDYDFGHNESTGVFDIHLSGKTCHSAFPEEGINAGEAMAELVQYVQTDKVIKTMGLDLEMAFTGASPSETDAIGEAFYDYRIDADEAPVELLDHVRQLVAGISGSDEITGSVQVYDQEVPWLDEMRMVHQYFPGWLMRSETSLIAALRYGMSSVGETKEDTWGFCTNCSGWNVKGDIEMAGIGPGDPNMAHQPNEFVPFSEMELVSAKLKAFLNHILEAHSVES